MGPPQGGCRSQRLRPAHELGPRGDARRRHSSSFAARLNPDPATSCEATVRFGAELAYEVTVVNDATASYSDQEMHAALQINIPNYATAILSAEEIVDAISNSTA
jgi:hypothetical protein